MEAAEAGHDDVVDMLLRAGADPNIKDRYQDSALILAVREGHKNIVARLVAGGADVKPRRKRQYAITAGGNPGGC